MINGGAPTWAPLLKYTFPEPTKQQETFSQSLAPDHIL